VGEERRNGNGGGWHKAAADSEAGTAEVLAYFGQCEDSRFRAAAQAAYREWPTPVLRIQFVMEDEEWKVAQVAPAPLSQLSQVERRPLIAAVEDEKSLSRRGSPTPHDSTRASIAVLFDESDPFSPSSPETLDRSSESPRA
jgi:hypothetical protein